ncbi:MAG TPA: hypothetical protein VHF01_14440 [Candidatus Acidoferrum sp.]|nr:hypothetical protein [Candidatus Acidoferrum sp.]
MAEEPKTKSKEEIKDLPKKARDSSLTEEDLGDVAGGTIPPIAGGIGVLRKPGVESQPNFEASTDGKPPTPTG